MFERRGGILAVHDVAGKVWVGFCGTELSRPVGCFI